MKHRLASLALALFPTVLTLTTTAANAAEPDLAASLTVKPRDLNTPRDFPRIRSRAEWKTRAEAIREQALVSCGLWPMPGRTPLEARTFDRVERDGYSIEKVAIQTIPGFYLCGNLYRPLGRGNGPFPGILNPHGHWAPGRMTDEKDGSVAARCINFARQGMVAFCYDMTGYNDTFFADDAPVTPEKTYLRHGRFATNKVNLLWNISLMGFQTWNSIRALDYLESLPDVDRKRLACTGESGGGTQTFMLGAVDDRLAVQAPIVMVSHTMQGGCLCENAPGLRIEYSNMEIAAAPAPRPQMLVAATGDWTRDTLKVEGPSIASIYDLLGTRDRFHYVLYDFGHNYNQTSREAVYGWFGKWLLGRAESGPRKELPYSKEPDAALRVWADGKLPAGARTEPEVVAYLKEHAQAQLQALQPSGKSGMRQFKRALLPAWKHTLQVEWPAPEPRAARRTASVAGDSTEYVIEPAGSAGAVIVQVFNPAKGGNSRWFVLASPTGVGNTETMPELAGELWRNGDGVAVVKRYSTGVQADPFSNFFPVYNRTTAQERVRDLIRVCAFVRGELKARQVTLCGAGRAGLWALLAAPAADAVVADCDRLDVSSDSSLLAPDLFCPGIRKLDAFQGAALLAAPNPLLLHNAGGGFPTDRIVAGYRAVGAAERVRVDDRALSSADLATWAAKIK
jgi:dienelactone hydrolase